MFFFFFKRLNLQKPSWTFNPGRRGRRGVVVNGEKQRQQPTQQNNNVDAKTKYPLGCIYPPNPPHLQVPLQFPLEEEVCGGGVGGGGGNNAPDGAPHPPFLPPAEQTPPPFFEASLAPPLPPPPGPPWGR